MADYSKMKNVELEALLKERNLTAGGKKAEMVARLQEADAAKPTSSEPAPTAQPVSPSKASPSPTSKPVDKSEAQNDQHPTNGTEAQATKTTTADAGAIEDKEGIDDEAARRKKRANKFGTKDSGDKKDAENPEESSAFGANLAATSLDEEIAKRKKRAEKFGTTEQESDAIRILERQKRFGVGAEATGEAEADTESGAGVNKLDEALSEKKARGRKRGLDEAGADAFEDEHLIKRRGGFRGRGRGRGRFRGRGGAQGGGRDASGPPKWMGEGDRTAREKRSAKFGQ